MIWKILTCIFGAALAVVLVGFYRILADTSGGGSNFSYPWRYRRADLLTSGVQRGERFESSLENSAARHIHVVSEQEAPDASDDITIITTTNATGQPWNGAACGHYYCFVSGTHIHNNDGTTTPAIYNEVGALVPIPDF